jgi:hypothetical protein
MTAWNADTVLKTVYSSKANWSWLRTAIRCFGPLLTWLRSGSSLPGQDFQEGGFAGAVGADRAVTVAGGKFDIDVLEDHSLAIGERNIDCVIWGPYSKKAAGSSLWHDVFRARKREVLNA